MAHEMQARAWRRRFNVKWGDIAVLQLTKCHPWVPHVDT